MTVGDRPTGGHKAGWCYACGHAGQVRLVRTSPTIRARKWKCDACVERSRAFKAARKKANDINGL